MKTIKNIISVERIYHSSLSGIRTINTRLVLLPSDLVWQNITCKIPASLVISDKDDDNNTIYTAKLIFKTCEDLDYRKHYCYRCKTADGHYLLIGTDERPYPKTNVQENYPDNLSDNQMKDVTVEYSSDRNIPVCR